MKKQTPRIALAGRLAKRGGEKRNVSKLSIADSANKGFFDLLEEHVRELVRKELSRERSRADADEWVSLRDVAGPKRRLYDAARSGELPARKVAKHWLVKRRDLDAWIEAHPAPTKPQPIPNEVDIARELARRLGIRTVEGASK